MSNRSFVQTAAVIGSEVVPVLVECDISEGPPSCTILGVERDYADALAAITRCAVKSCYFEWPRRPVIVSLTPLDKITHDAHLLLPIACAVLSATGQVKMPEKVLAIGEVGLGENTWKDADGANRSKIEFVCDDLTSYKRAASGAAHAKA